MTGRTHVRARVDDFVDRIARVPDAVEVHECRNELFLADLLPNSLEELDRPKAVEVVKALLVVLKKGKRQRIDQNLKKSTRTSQSSSAAFCSQFSPSQLRSTSRICVRYMGQRLSFRSQSWLWR